VRQPAENGAEIKRSTRVRLIPSADWHKRNFLTTVLIPSLFTKRSGDRARPHFPKIRKGEVGITWIGHASFLIQTHEFNLLIDPIWSKWLKVIKRLKQPGFEIHHLPEIDFVLVTHAHFDHLDRPTLRRLPKDSRVVTAPHTQDLIRDLGFRDITELKRREQAQANGKILGVGIGADHVRHRVVPGHVLAPPVGGRLAPEEGEAEKEFSKVVVVLDRD